MFSIFIVLINTGLEIKAIMDGEEHHCIKVGTLLKAVRVTKEVYGRNN